MVWHSRAVVSVRWKLKKVDAMPLNRAARRIVTMRREVLFALADIRATLNQYVLKNANLLDSATSRWNDGADGCQAARGEELCP